MTRTTKAERLRDLREEFPGAGRAMLREIDRLRFKARTIEIGWT